MSPAEIEKLKALEREATPGPWKQSDAQANVIEQDLGFSHMIALFSTYDAQEGRVYPGEDAACVAAMRNALPRLLEERERLLEALKLSYDEERCWAHDVAGIAYAAIDFAEAPAK